ncbi:DUF1990 family protein [Actinomarinicola tropica]|uniref:DUF1990 family protein n=1 Tax=Actinomarinicola tropica TaxID=2789776 RepID=UPI00189AA28B|nr:DUF1990 domain-containing protein [Actinomarinicola tropica]
MLRLNRPTPEDLREVARRRGGEEPTFARLGASLLGEAVDGYVHDDASVVLGHGDATFDAARTVVRRFGAQRGAGIQVADGAEVRPGAAVAMAAPLPLGWILAVCRVVEVVDEPDRYGFSYVTLPLHPEEGEEAFLVERGAAGEVRFRVVAWSRARWWPARLAGPVARRLQVRALRRYLTAVQEAVA